MDQEWMRIDRLSDAETDRELIAKVFGGDASSFLSWEASSALFDALNSDKSVPTMKRLKLYRSVISCTDHQFR